MNISLIDELLISSPLIDKCFRFFKFSELAIAIIPLSDTFELSRTSFIILLTEDDYTRSSIILESTFKIFLYYKVDFI